MSALTAIASTLRGELCRGEPLARHTSWRVGEPAARLYRPADRDDLVAFLRALAADEPLLWLGLGSNLLISAAGFPGTVIQTTARLIEAAGLKGSRIGGAEVSPKHANFIIKTGTASAREIALLIDRVQAEVERGSGIRLIPEVHRVGELS